MKRFNLNTKKKTKKNGENDNKKFNYKYLNFSNTQKSRISLTYHLNLKSNAFCIVIN